MVDSRNIEAKFIVSFIGVVEVMEETHYRSGWKLKLLQRIRNEIQRKVSVSLVLTLIAVENTVEVKEVVIVVVMDLNVIK